MMRSFLVAMLVGGLFVATPGVGLATVEKNIVGTLTVPGGPVDSVVSADGALLFVLTGQGKVYIYENKGTLKDVLDVGGAPDMITTSPKGDLLYLTDKDSGAVQIVSVDFVQKINAEGNFYKGPVDAPVVISVFSDFQ